MLECYTIQHSSSSPLLATNFIGPAVVVVDSVYWSVVNSVSWAADCVRDTCPHDFSAVDAPAQLPLGYSKLSSLILETVTD